MSLFDQIGTEALAIRMVELSKVTAQATGRLNDAERAEWDAIILERREYMNKLIDEAMTGMNMRADFTLNSIHADRARRRHGR